MSAASPQQAARAVFEEAREPQAMRHAVVRFHRQVDAILAESHRVHGVEAACRRGCAHCCHMQVEVLMPEAFALADWLRRHRTPAELARIEERLRENAERTRAAGAEGRKRMNLACALLGEDGACTAYEARPAQCRRFHSLDLAACEASFADPADDTIMSPAHPLVAHNAQVIVTLAQHGLRGQDLDAEPRDMNLALHAALVDAKAWRRWRDGKRAVAAALRALLPLVPAFAGLALAFEDG